MSTHRPRAAPRSIPNAVPTGNAAALQTFTARSMAEALQRVKQALGPEAVILGTRIVPASGARGLVGQQHVEITAAPPSAVEPAGKAESTRQATVAPHAVREASRSRSAERANGGARGERAVRADLLPVYQHLVEQEVAEQWVKKIVGEAELAGAETAPEAVREAVRSAIARLVPVPATPSPGARRIALVGPAGAGKTTTLAKLAAHYGLKERRTVAVLSLDLQGLTSNELLRRYAELIGVPFHAAQSVTAVKEQLTSLDAAEIVLIDTFGVSPRDEAKFLRLASLVRAARPDEVHLALPATMNGGAQARYHALFGPLGPSRLILTRLDEAAGMGVILNAVAQLGLALSFTTDGPHVPRDVQWGCGKRLAQLLCPG